MTAATLADTIFFVVFFILISLNNGKKLPYIDVANKRRSCRLLSNRIDANMFMISIYKKIHKSDKE
jgi:hypothetical protein